MVIVGGAELFTGNSLIVMAWAARRVSLAALLRNWAVVLAGNALVCLAVWLSFSARTAAGRVLVIVPPVAAFVAAGFERSVANLYFVPVALLIEAMDPAFATSAGVGVPTAVDFLVGNPLPVTIGNILGGGGLVGGVYWFVSLRGRHSPASPPPASPHA